MLGSSVVATHISLLSGEQCVAPFASLGQAHWAPSAVVWGDGGGGGSVGFFLWLTEKEVLVWVGSMVMDRFGSLLWFCGCSLVWSLRRRFVGYSLGRSEVVRMVEVAGCGQGHGALRMVAGSGDHVVGHGPRSSRQQPQESHSVTFATAEGAVPKFTFGILTLPLGGSPWLLRAQRGAGLAGKKNRCFT